MGSRRDDADAFILGRQLLAADRLIIPMMVANVMVAGGLTVLMAASHARVVLPWFVIVTLVSALRWIKAYKALHGSGRPHGRASLVQEACEAMLLGLIMNGVPAWLITQTTGMTGAIILCQVTGIMWAGSLLLTTLYPAAVAYVSLTVALICGGLLAAGPSLEHIYLVILFLAGGATALHSALLQSRVFVSDLRREMDLKGKGDVIGLLLKDYEEQTSDWLWEIDEAMRFRNPSDRFVRVADRPVATLEAQTIWELMTVQEVPGNAPALASLQRQVEERSSFRDLVVPFAVAGEACWWSMAGRPTFDRDGGFTGYRGVGTDVTSAQQAEARIAHLAHHDGLTNLPNRSFFAASLDQALRTPDLGRLAVLSLDLDGFKAVNDKYGHPVGDALLVAVGARLRATLDSRGLVARFGGDEFVVLLTDVAGSSDLEALCQRLIDHIVAGFDIEGIDVTVGISIGVAFARIGGTTRADLLRNADAALYRAKTAGRGTYRFFSPDADRLLQERQLLAQDLRVALGRNELRLFFQSYVAAEGKDVTGCEALVRWQHPVRGLIPPADFIPLAEESGLIVAIGAWVIEEACREAARWPADRRVSVNISPIQFRTRALPQVILSALTRAGLAPSRLEIEVTEAVLIEDAEAALDLLRQIRALGVRVALDDFGTGYSSLSYLRLFPFDKVKIDRSFVRELGVRHDSQVIVSAIRDIAQGLGMTITAEGVETLEQADRLTRTGCQELQGFLYSRPVPPEQLGLRVAA